MTYGIENDIYCQLLKLRNSFNLVGVKASFEDEGASFNEVMRLRRITESLGVKLYLKISGAEAIRDIRDSLELGVDGLIAPMIESAYAARKFIHAVKRIYDDENIKMVINIESKAAIENLESIIEVCAEDEVGITIGRNDLAASFANYEVTPFCSMIMGIVQNIINSAIGYGIPITIGGNITAADLGELAKISGIDYIETRKAILHADTMTGRSEALGECLKIEELCILSKREMHDLSIRGDARRYEVLGARKQKESSC